MAPTRKDFRASAAVIKAGLDKARRSSKPEAKAIEEAWAIVGHAMAQRFQEASPRFDRARFLTASGLAPKEA